MVAHFRDFDPVDGVDYIVDHYKVLGVPADADADVIKNAYRQNARQYHPDIVARAAPEIQKIAEKKMQLLTNAYAVLSDQGRREKFDALLSSFPPELRSKDGTPIISLARRRIDIDFLVAGEWNEKDSYLALIAETCGHNEELFETIKEQYEANPSEKLSKAYQALLEKKLTYLSLMEDVAWESAGVSAQSAPKVFGYAEDYAAQRHEQIDQARRDIRSSVSQRVQALEAGGQKMLIGGCDVAEGLSEKLTDLAMSTFESRTAEIAALAHEKADVLEELVKFTNWEYCPAEQPKQDRLLIAVMANEQVLTDMLFTYTADTSVSVDRASLLTGLGAEEAKQKAPELVERGLSVAMVYHNPEMDIMMEMMHVVGLHK